MNSTESGQTVGTGSQEVVLLTYEGSKEKMLSCTTSGLSPTEFKEYGSANQESPCMSQVKRSYCASCQSSNIVTFASPQIYIYIVTADSLGGRCSNQGVNSPRFAPAAG